jgi:hypothetical protein
MWSKKWYLKRNVSCVAHLLNELLEIDVIGMMLSWCWQVNWGNCGISEVNCAILCVTDGLKRQFWGMRYCLPTLSSLLSFLSGMMSYLKIAQFNWECIGRFTETMIRNWQKDCLVEMEAELKSYEVRQDGKWICVEIRSFTHSFHCHVQNATNPCRSQELLPFLSVIYVFLLLFSTNYSSILPHFILPSISWSTSWSCLFQIHIQYSYGNSVFFHSLYMSKPTYSTRM